MTVDRQNREAGIASMLVTMIIIIITSLIVLGFAQAARRNQREALDRQVSSQAYYAAETGVNDAVATLKGQIIANNVSAKTNCVGGTGTWSALNSVKSTIGEGTLYSCLIVNPSPTTLLYSQVSQGKSTVVPINTNLPIGNLTISWKANGSESRNPAACNDSGSTLPAQASWGCDYSLMRFDLTKYGGDYSATTLSANTATFYLKPSTGSQTVTVPTLSDPDKRSFINSIRCTQATSTCTATLNFTADLQSRYFMRMTAMYRDASQVTIAATGTTGQTLTLTGAQAIIDSTGRSQDQLRRISVRLPLTTANNTDTFPINSLQTAQAICKRFTIGEYLPVTPANLCEP